MGPRFAILSVLATLAAAFSPGMQPLALKSSTRSTNIEMMPKFLKDLFPDMDKPDDALGKIKDFFGGMMPKDEEPAAPVEAMPEDAPAEEPKEEMRSRSGDITMMADDNPLEDAMNKMKDFFGGLMPKDDEPVAAPEPVEDEAPSEEAPAEEATESKDSRSGDITMMADDNPLEDAMNKMKDFFGGLMPKDDEPVSAPEPVEDEAPSEEAPAEEAEDEA